MGLVTGANAADEFRYQVFRSKFPRDEAGQLEISRAGVAYRSDNGKTKLQIRLVDILEADLSDPKAIRLETYDVVKRRLTGRRTHTFRLREGKHDEVLVRFLVDSIPRPVIGSYGSASSGAFEIWAYHRHRLGGCHGKLQISAENIRFASENPEDSRTWLYIDMETIGTMTPFHFRVTTLAETYNFDLKERLPEGAYRLAWQQLYRLPAGVSVPAALGGPASVSPRIPSTPSRTSQGAIKEAATGSAHHHPAVALASRPKSRVNER
jgi:hypothetical protein